MDSSGRLLQLVNGYQVSQALHVAATLRISDLLASGPHDVAELAAATDTHAPTLRRLMRALEGVDVYSRDENGRYVNTELGEQLRADVPESVGAWAAYVGRPYYREAWTGLLGSVRTGDNAFATAHGTSCWEYRLQHPEEQVVFDRAMTSTAGPVLHGVVSSYDFGRFAIVADVGGGVGTLLVAILEHHPTVTGVLVDQAEVIERAGPVLEAAGLVDRCEVVAGNFFDSVPAGADAYVLKSVIHDWLDAEAVAILRTCRRAMKDDATLLLVEQLVGEGPNPAHTAFSDLNMLVSPGGQERTLDEYGALLDAAGFTLTGATGTGTPAFVIAAVPTG